MRPSDRLSDRVLEWLLTSGICLLWMVASGCSEPLSGGAGSERGDREQTESGKAWSEASTEIESQHMSEKWKEIDALIDEQKYREALESAERLLAGASGGEDGESWTRALIQVVQLETGLHGYESAVVRLR